MNEMTAEEVADILEQKYNIQGPAKIVIDELNARAVAVNYLRKIASGEYAPVVHAHWKHYSDIFPPECSNCNWDTEDDEYRNDVMTPYCPSCGALMDGKDDSHEAD